MITASRSWCLAITICVGAARWEQKHLAAWAREYCEIIIMVMMPGWQECFPWVIGSSKGNKTCLLSHLSSRTGDAPDKEQKIYGETLIFSICSLSALISARHALIKWNKLCAVEFNGLASTLMQFAFEIYTHTSARASKAAKWMRFLKTSFVNNSRNHRPLSLTKIYNKRASEGITWSGKKSWHRELIQVYVFAFVLLDACVWHTEENYWRCQRRGK